MYEPPIVIDGNPTYKGLESKFTSYKLNVKKKQMNSDNTFGVI